jgi:flagellar hook protein FlgE
MLGSMYSAVSGLQTHQTKMNVIGNNIANVNTYGFKSSRVTFSDVFYQTISGASAPRENGGGTNASQMGYGSKVSSVDVIHTRAGSATTDRALDIYINGDGYLPVKDSNGIVKYTRVGVLNFDESGNLVDTNGNMVLGFQLTGSDKKASLSSDGTTGITNLEPIKISQEELKKYLGISIGQNGELTGIKEGDPTITPAAGTGQWMTSATASTDALYSGQV